MTGIKLQFSGSQSHTQNIIVLQMQSSPSILSYRSSHLPLHCLIDVFISLNTVLQKQPFASTLSYRCSLLYFLIHIIICLYIVLQMQSSTVYFLVDVIFYLLLYLSFKENRSYLLFTLQIQIPQQDIYILWHEFNDRLTLFFIKLLKFACYSF